ncbi:putative nuclease of the RNAse H fold, HicB family [Methanophagales archaeon]|nr:putative nuclease of the RNAse H fold, HicB family [Methanophagales archaeon]
MESRFTAVFQKTDKWWIAFVKELPGANAQGGTIDEARENLKEAVELILNKDEMLAEVDMKDILNAMAEIEKGHYYTLKEVFE